MRQVYPDNCPPFVDMSNVPIADVMDVDMCLENKTLWLHVVRRRPTPLPLSLLCILCSHTNILCSPQLPRTVKAQISTLLAAGLLRWQDLLEVTAASDPHPHPTPDPTATTNSAPPCRRTAICSGRLDSPKCPSGPSPSAGTRPCATLCS